MTAQTHSHDNYYHFHCTHTLEKIQLLLQERDKEVIYLKKEVEHLTEMLLLLKSK